MTLNARTSVLAHALICAFDASALALGCGDDDTNGAQDD
jgi:hypothetical protein